MPEQCFPKLSTFVSNLRSGLKQFDLNDIHDLLRDRRDRDFLNRAKSRLKYLQEAITEIQKKCIDLQPSLDPGQIRFLLWRSILAGARQKSNAPWDAEKIGLGIVERARAAGDKRFVCVPLFGSVAPLSKEPRMHLLTNGVWLVEPSRSIDRLLIHLEALLGGFPEEIELELRKIGDPTESEYGALFFAPLIVFWESGFFSLHGYSLRKFGVPLIALHNIVTVNRLDTSDDLGFWGYMMQAAPPAWPQNLESEWRSLTDDPFALEMGLTDPHEIGSIADASRHIASFEFDLREKHIRSVAWGSKTPPPQPPIIILPSLIDFSLTKKLIEFGQKLSELPAIDLDRRIAHATTMWVEACSKALETEWDIGFEEHSQDLVIADPDSLILYGTIVLETLFSSSGYKQEVTTRIADLTAGLLGTSSDHRYELSYKMRGAYGQRSDFVHGVIDRSTSYSGTAMWLFKIATLALWETVRLKNIAEPPYSDCNHFIEHIERRKFGADKR